MKILFKTLRYLAYALVVLLTLVALFAWRLHRAPVDISMFKSVVERHLPGLEVADIKLAWPILSQVPQWELEGVTYKGPWGQVVVPHMVLEFNIAQLTMGHVFLESAQLVGPCLTLRRLPHVPDPQAAPTHISAQKILREWGRWLAAHPLLRTMVAHIEIVNGQIKMTSDDPSTPLATFFDGVSGHFTTEGEGSHLHVASALHHPLSSKLSRLELEMSIEAGEGLLRLEVEHLPPSHIFDTFVVDAPYLGLFRGLFSGSVRVEAVLDRNWHGALDAALDYETLAPGKQAEASFRVHGLIREEEGNLVYETLIALSPLDLAGIPALWPSELASEVREWFVFHIPQGELTKGTFTLTGKLSEKPEETKVLGQLNLQNATFYYMDGVPPVTGVGAESVYKNDVFDIKILSGATKNIRVHQGFVRLGGLDQPEQYANMGIHVTTPLNQALWLLDFPALRTETLQGVFPHDVSGRAEIQLNMTFPLSTSLSQDEIELYVEADLEEVGFEKKLLGANTVVQKGSFSMHLNPDKFALEGQAVVGGMPASFTWEGYLKGDQPFTNQYTLTLKPHIADLAPYPLFKGVLPYLKGGPLPLDLTLTRMASGHGLATLKADVDHTEVTIPLLDWTKPPGVPGFLTCSLDLFKEVPQKITQLIFETPEASVHGRAAFAADGSLSRATIDHFRLGKNDLSGSVGQGPQGEWEIDLKGRTLNVAPYLDRGHATEGESQWMETFKKGLLLTAKIDHVFLDHDVTLDKLALSLRYRNEAWVFVQGVAAVGKSPLKIIYKEHEGKRHFLLTTPNIGALLRGLNMAKDAYGGELTVLGEGPVENKKAPLQGEIFLKRITFKNAPILVQLLSLASISSIPELFGETGLRFESGRALFEGTLDKIIFREGLFANASLGLTVEGWIDLDKGKMDMEGSIIPMYAVNKGIAHIPLLGTLLSGAAAKEGVFSIPYQATGDVTNPQLMVNPLVMWLPTGIRRLFTKTQAPPPTPSVS